MDNSPTAHFYCRKHIADPEAIRLAGEREADPNILSCKDRYMLSIKDGYGNRL